MNDTLDRLARLEAEVHSLRRGHARWRRATLVAGALAVLATLAGLAADDIVEVVRARAIEVVDANGKVCIKLAAAEHGGQLDLWARGGAEVARLTASESGGDLSLWNTAGKAAAGIFANSGGGRVEVSRGDGQLAADLRATDEGGQLQVQDASGQTVAEALASASGGSLLVRRGNGEVSAQLDSTIDGSTLKMSRAGSKIPAVIFRVEKDRSEAVVAHAEANSVLVFGATRKGAAVTVWGRDDHEIAYVGGDERGAGKLRLSSSAAAGMVTAGVGDHGGELMVRTTDDKPGALLGTNANGGYSETHAKDGTIATRAMSTENGAALETHAKDGTLTARMSATDRGGAVEAFNGDGKAVARMSVQDNNGGRIAAHTATGQIVAFIDQGKEESGTLQLYAGQNRIAALGASQTGGLLNLFNMKGKAVFIAGAAVDGPGGTFTLQTDDGTRTVRGRAEPTPDVTVTSTDGKRKSVLTPPPQP